MNKKDVLIETFSLSSEVVMTHMPTGIRVTCSSSPSRILNRLIAFNELEIKLLNHLQRSLKSYNAV